MKLRLSCSKIHFPQNAISYTATPKNPLNTPSTSTYIVFAGVLFGNYPQKPMEIF